MRPRPPLDAWLAGKLGCGREELNKERLRRYQEACLTATLQWSLEHSPFYRRRLRGLAASAPELMAAWTELPCTTDADLRQFGPEFLCLSQSEICRIVTMDTSGTTGQAKRLYFTREDQVATVDFFAAGMSTLVDRGDRVLILLPGGRPGSVGDLLARALQGLGVEAISHGPVCEPAATLRVMRERSVTSVVGIPAQVLALARWPEADKPPRRLKSVLLSADRAAQSLVRAIESRWRCRVLDHYGMTEMGLGGGIDCSAHTGYHLRENDLYFEVIDPVTGLSVPEGEAGEVVFTTLNRLGMPLIRYRTGDISRFLQEPCPCGSAFRRLDYIHGRADTLLRSAATAVPTLTELDEALFAIPGVIDFAVRVDPRTRPAKLDICLYTIGSGTEAAAAARRQLGKSGAEFAVRAEACGGSLPGLCSKRKIEWVEEKGGKQDGLSAAAWKNSD